VRSLPARASSNWSASRPPKPLSLITLSPIIDKPGCVTGCDFSPCPKQTLNLNSFFLKSVFLRFKKVLFPNSIFVMSSSLTLSSRAFIIVLKGGIVRYGNFFDSNPLYLLTFLLILSLKTSRIVVSGCFVWISAFPVTIISLWSFDQISFKALWTSCKTIDSIYGFNKSFFCCSDKNNPFLFMVARIFLDRFLVFWVEAWLTPLSREEMNSALTLSNSFFANPNIRACLKAFSICLRQSCQLSGLHSALTTDKEILCKNWPE